MSLYRLFSQTGTKSVFIAPQDSTQRMSFASVSTPKKVSGVPLLNRRVEIRVGRSVDPRDRACTDCTPIREPLSASVVFSGSTTAEAQASLVLMKQDLIDAINAKWDELVVIGVSPQDNAGLNYNETVVP